MRPKVKICCISSINEARLALQYGTDALGLVSEMPSGPGVIDAIQIREIIQALPASTDTFLLTSKQDVESIVRQYTALRPKTIQIVDDLPRGGLEALKARVPEARLVQVIHVLDENSILQAQEASRFADAILLDSGNPNLQVKTLGGTGKTHDWTLSRRIVETIAKPVWLAGGLRAENVAQAVAQVQPYGLDLCSGVRTAGQLDEQKLMAFMAAATYS